MNKNLQKLPFWSVFYVTFYGLFFGCKIHFERFALCIRLTFFNSILKQFEQSGTQNPLSQKFRRSNQDSVELKSSTESNKCALKVSEGNKDLENTM